MAERVSALNGQTATGTVELRDGGLRGMITLRGDLSDTAVQRAACEATGVEFPERGKAVVTGQSGLCWMSPDELLVLVPYVDAGSTVATLTKALTGVHHLAADVSDARTLITIEGDDLREILGKLAPVDLHPESFGPGQFRRTRLGQVAAAFWLEDDRTAHVICFRSVAGYVLNLMEQSSTDGAIGHY